MPAYRLYKIGNKRDKRKEDAIKRFLKIIVIILLIVLVAAGVVFVVRKSAENESYLYETLLLFEKTVVANGKISDISVRISTAEISVNDGIKEINRWRGELAAIRKEAAASTPPQRFDQFQNNYLSALDLYIESSTKLEQGYKLENKAIIKKGADIWPKANSEMKRAFEILEKNRP